MQDRSTLGGCVAANYGSYTGSYYPGGYAYPGYIYGYPGNSAGFGGFWVGGEHGHWPRWHGSRGNWHNHRSGWHGTRGNWHGHPAGGIQGSVAGTGEPFLEVAGIWRHCQTNMGRLVTFAVGWCLASSALAQSPQDHLTSRQSREKQSDHSRRQLEQQQQLNQERFRAERGWQLHPRPQAPWEERRREDELRKEFQRGRQPPSP